MSTYYRIAAYNRSNLDSPLRGNDIVTILHYGATSDLRVSGAKFVEEKNCIPSLTFNIYPQNPGYDKLVEFDTIITLEEMGDEPATDYLGEEVVRVEDEVLEMLDVSEAYAELDSDGEYTLVVPDYGFISQSTNAAGLIEDGDYVLNFSRVGSDGTMPTTRHKFEGRVLSNTIQLDSDGVYYREVTCEGLLGYLCDSEQPYMEERLWEDSDESTGLQKYLIHLLEVHNSQVEPHKQMNIGICDTTTNVTNNQVTKGTDWQTTWEVIQDKLLDVYGGEIKVERGSDGLLYLYYTDKMADLNTPSKPLQPITLGSNIIDGSYEPKVSQVITRLYPLGAKLDDADGNQTDERLTIESVEPYGRAYIEDDEAVKRYGIIPGVEEWDDVTLASNLYTKAVEWLAENNNFPVALSLSAYDLSLLGYDYERLELYTEVQVTADILQTELLGDDGKLEIVKRTLDLDEPWASTIEFEETTQTSSSQYAESAKKGSSGSITLVGGSGNYTYLYSGVPSGDTYPANEWTDDKTKARHVGDLYFDENTGYLYRWTKIDDNYFWLLIENEDVLSALLAAEALAEKIAELEAIVDNTIETYFEAGAPTLDNYPANQWTDDETKAKHVGDLYYDSNNGYCYRFALDTSTGEFLWVLIQDNDITEALGELHDAIEAQEKLQEEFEQYKADTDAAIAELPSTVLSEAAETFATKTETAVMQSELQASISANAAGIDSLAERLDTAESELGDISITYATKSELTQTAGEINTKVSSVEVVANTAASDAQEALEKATEMDVDISALTDRMTTAESEISQQADQIASTVTKAETAYSTAADAKAAAEQAQAAAEDAADAAAQAQADIDNLAIGSRNILRNSESVTHERFTTDPNADEDTDETFEPDPLNDTLNRIPFWEISEFGRSIIGMNSATDENTGDEDTGDEGTETEGSTGTGTNIIFFADYEVRDLTTACDMAFSFVVESLADDGETTESTYVPFGELVPLEAGDDIGGHIEMHFEVTEAMVGATGVVVSGFGAGQNDGCTVIFAHAQMEQGTIASTWVAAPEDEIAERDAQIEEMDSRYSELTTELSSRIEQNADSIEFVLNETISGLTDDLNSTTEIVNELSSYVRITMDEDGNPLLELGALQNALKALLSNSELGFYDDNVRVAYISNQMLHIDSAEIVGELSLGEWIWRNTSDGGLGLKYVG